MKKLVLILLSLSLVLMSGHALAIRVPGLYEAEVPVRDQDVNRRRQAIAEAMKLVLVKLTGDRNAAGRIALNPVIETAENYIQQYRYLEAPVSDLPGADSRLSIMIRFDEAKLNNALRNLGIQVWGRERPSTLVWIAIEDGNSRRIMQPEEDPVLFSEIEQRAKARGIVLINPLFDLQDNFGLRVSDIWGGFHFTVRNASQRYYPDLILTGKISSPMQGIWEGQWTVYLANDERTFSTEGSFLGSVLDEGIDGVADIISASFAQASVADAGNAVLKVIDVISVQQYAKVLNYLQSLSPVTDVEVTRVNPGNMEFRISAHGGQQAVTQAINFGRVLEQVGGNLNMYRLLP